MGIWFCFAYDGELDEFELVKVTVPKFYSHSPNSNLPSIHLVPQVTKNIPYN